MISKQINKNENNTLNVIKEKNLRANLIPR